MQVGVGAARRGEVDEQDVAELAACGLWEEDAEAEALFADGARRAQTLSLSNLPAARLDSMSAEEQQQQAGSANTQKGSTCEECGAVAAGYYHDEGAVYLCDACQAKFEAGDDDAPRLCEECGMETALDVMAED
eukprot:3215804-Rhodomonas_salina.1